MIHYRAVRTSNKLPKDAKDIQLHHSQPMPRRTVRPSGAKGDYHLPGFWARCWSAPSYLHLPKGRFCTHKMARGVTKHVIHAINQKARVAHKIQRHTVGVHMHECFIASERRFRWHKPVHPPSLCGVVDKGVEFIALDGSACCGNQSIHAPKMQSWLNSATVALGRCNGLHKRRKPCGVRALLTHADTRDSDRPVACRMRHNLRCKTSWAEPPKT